MPEKQQYWIARDRPGGLVIFEARPTVVDEHGEWEVPDGRNFYTELPEHMFPEVTFMNSPQLLAATLPPLGERSELT